MKVCILIFGRLLVLSLKLFANARIWIVSISLSVLEMFNSTLVKYICDFNM